jgi:hypothetical protein
LEYTLTSKSKCGVSRSVNKSVAITCLPFLEIGLANNSIKANNNYKIYPNPSSDLINIALADNNNLPKTKSKIIAELFDLNGNKKSKVEIMNDIASINVVGMPKGIYVLKINIDGTIESHLVAVQ